MQWITRARPKIDRIACPWLIRKFVDPDAEFLYVAASDVRNIAAARGAIPYDNEALYAWCKTCQEETHNWPPKM